MAEPNHADLTSVWRRIRLTGLLKENRKTENLFLFFYGFCFTGDSSGWPRGGPDGGFLEPLGAVARRDSWSCRLESLRIADANTRRATLPRWL